jgi:hypothetical protein
VNGDIINFTSDIVVNSELTISGKTLTMNGNNYEISVPVPGLDNMGRFNTSPSSFRVFNFSSSANITINNLTIKGGSTSSSGGAIVVGSGCILNLNNSIVTNSRVSGFAGGGGIAIFGTLFMRNSFIRRNAAHYGGGILVSNSAKAFVEQSTLVGELQNVSSVRYSFLTTLHSLTTKVQRLVAPSTIIKEQSISSIALQRAMWLSVVLREVLLETTEAIYGL